MSKPELGDIAKDVLTGFEGVVIQPCDHLTGCTTYGLKPRALTEKGETRDCAWFDEHQLEVLEAGTFAHLVIPPSQPQPTGARAPRAGGPQEHPPENWRERANS